MSKEVAVNGDNRMTVKEVAEALNCSERTIQEHIKIICPEIVQNGKTTYINEDQATKIKLRVQNSGRHDLANVRELASIETETEIAMMTAKVLGYWKAKADELSRQAEINAPKVESFNQLMRSESTMSITDASKHFELHPKTQVFPYLRAKGLLTTKDIPMQVAIDMDLLALKESISSDGTVRKQAVVMTYQLEKWRTYLVPRIVEWSK